MGSRDLDDRFKVKVISRFDQLLNELESYQKLDPIELIPVRSAADKRSFISQFTAEENRIRHEKAKATIEVITQPTVGEKDASYTAEKSVKVIESVQLDSLVDSRTRVKTPEDIDTYVNKIKQELLNKLNDGNEIDILL